MPHFFIKKENIENNIIALKDPLLLRHLVSSLRIKAGEKIKFIDENEIQYICEVIEARKNFLSAEIIQSEKSERKLNFELHLAQCILKSEAQSLAISNAVQCGVKKIFPVFGDNSCASSKQNIEKWQKIADESFKQCERADRAIVEKITTLKEVMEKYGSNIIIFAEKNADTKLKDAVKKLDQTRPILVVIGPEGGFSEKEFEMFEKFSRVSLGKLIFKAPNAITAGLFGITYELENG